MIAASEIRAMGIEKSGLTVSEKIIFHLGDYVNADRYVMPYALTQDGIAVACGITRAHASIELKKLMGKGTIETRKTHVSGCRTIRNVYFLSQKGKESYNQLKERTGLDSREVLYSQNKEIKGTRDPILDRCFRKVLRCALELYVQRDKQKPVLTDVETDLLDVVKTMCRK